MTHKRKLKKIDLHKFVSKTAQRGSIPGTVEYIGQPRKEDVRIDVLEFDESTFATESVINSVNELEGYLNHPGIKWIQITGVHNSEILSEIDIIIDHYFTLIEDIGESIEETEEELVTSPGQASQEAIYKIKRLLGYVKKTIWPAREVLNQLQRSDHLLVHDETRIYFRNNYDHTIQIIETLESLRDLTSGMMDLYLSTVSDKMNEIMKVLTIFSTIFIPLTFFAGVYGMNFKYLPELEWKSGYYIFWGIMVTITLIMLIFFRRKKWF